MHGNMDRRQSLSPRLVSAYAGMHELYTRGQLIFRREDPVLRLGPSTLPDRHTLYPTSVTLSLRPMLAYSTETASRNTLTSSAQS